MRIEALHLLAFGPFTNKSIEFSGESAATPGFHLVYGANEAGKSSALRALRALFFGISERSPDGFLHPYPKMRVGGRIRSETGERLAVIRRKGRGSTLRAEDDRTVLPESTLADLLGHVDADLFATMFAIGYDDLVAGGREILAGGGDLGQMIFSAGSGVVHLKGVRDGLKAEAEALFKPSGKNPLINAVLSELRENREQLERIQLSGSRWAELDDELKAAEGRRGILEKELSEKEAARSHLARVQEALPFIARRRELLAQLAFYGSVRVLPEDFPEKRRRDAAALDAAKKEAERAGAARAAVEKELAAIPATDTILANASLIETLHQQLGSQQKAAADRVKLETRRSTLLGEAKDILSSLSDELALDDAETLRVKKERAAAIRRLSSEYEQIAARLASARESIPGISDEIERLRKTRSRMGKPRDPAALEALQAALSEAVEYGALEKQNQRLLAELEAAARTLKNRQTRLGLPHRDSAGLETIPFPGLETIQGYEDRFDAVKRKIDQFSREREQAVEQIRQTEVRIETCQGAQAVATESDLEAARARRDQGWELLRRTLEGEKPSAEAVSAYLRHVPEAETVAAGFEQCMYEADALADRLRREADRVTELSRLKAEHAAAGSRLDEVSMALETAQKEQAALLEEWAARWREAGISAKSPREMERWVRDATELKKALAGHEERVNEARQTAGAISRHRKALAAQLEALEEEAPDRDSLSLAQLIRKGQALLESENHLISQKERIEADIAARQKEFAAARARQAAAEEDLERWRANWEAALAPLGLSPDALPAEAAEVLEEIRALFEKLKEAEVLKQRIQGIDRDAEEFSRGVINLAETAAPDLCERQAPDIVLNLQDRLTRAREAKTRKRELEKQLAAEQQNLIAARREASEIEARLSRMCEEAGCGSVEELPRAEAYSGKRLELEAELKSVEDRILSLSGGAMVEDFVNTVAAVDPDAIAPEIERLEEAIKGLSEERDSLAEKIGSLRNELSRMDGSAEAAKLAEKHQSLLGRLEPEVRRYACARIATHVLDRAIERFREKNQGPILSRASSLFSEMTCSAFGGVRAEFDDGGRPVIAGVRGGGKEVVHVSGMSEGTADQLYLALRLAGLEAALARGEPLPFIVDDILIKFDNDRALAALKVLSGLSARTQVVFFTHHDHLVSLARHHLPENAFRVHEL